MSSPANVSVTLIFETVTLKTNHQFVTPGCSNANYLSTFLFRSIQRLRSYQVHKISKAVAANLDIENLFNNVHSYGEYLCQVSLKSQRFIARVTRESC